MRAGTHERLEPRPAVAALGLSVGLGVVDLLLPPDVLVAMAYVVPLVVAAFSRSLAFIWGLGLALTAMNLLSLLSSRGPLGELHPVIVLNHLILAGQLLVLTLLSHLLCAQGAAQRLLRRRAQEGERQALEASRLKDGFLASVSHELRTPLTPILSWVALLRRPGSPERWARGLDAIERNARAQARLVDDLLVAARIDEGRAPLERRPLELGRLVAKVVERARPAATAKGVRLSCHRRGRPWVEGDRRRLEQVLAHLVANAIKFTPALGQVEVEVAAVGAEARVRVRDTGEGIAPGFLPALFEGFRRAPRPRTRWPTGLGLGLSVARRLVERHGGRIDAESEGPGRGAVFTVWLPARAPEALAPARAEPASASASP